MKKHARLVTDLCKPGIDIKQSLTVEKIEMLHMALGIAGETGELVDAVKKHVMYEKEIDRENVIEELGDLEFYMEGLRQILAIDRKETLEANYDKLKVRYKTGYSNKAAQLRADKNGS